MSTDCSADDYSEQEDARKKSSPKEWSHKRIRTEAHMAIQGLIDAIEDFQGFMMALALKGSRVARFHETIRFGRLQVRLLADLTKELFRRMEERDRMAMPPPPPPTKRWVGPPQSAHPPQHLGI